MKHSAKNKKQPARPPSLPTPAPGASPRRWLVIGLGVLLTAGVTWAVFEYYVWATTPSELVGKWVVTEGPDKGGTVDFYRNGTMVAKVNQQGMEGIIEAKIRVEDNKIYVTTRHQQTGEVGTRVQTIKVLDENRLVLLDERGMSVKMERAR
jgi:uncharacterized protein (TIGR03066 family)